MKFFKGLMPLLILIFVLVLMLVSCSPYKTPKTGTYYLKLEVVKAVIAVREVCRVPIVDELACARPDLIPCPIVVPAETWDKNIIEEIAHCLDIYWHY